jgi:hypothetical protein
VRRQRLRWQGHWWYVDSTRHEGVLLVRYCTLGAPGWTTRLVPHTELEELYHDVRLGVAPGPV